MAYTPELKLETSRLLRRIAWGLGLPMTKALSRIIQHAVRERDYCRICEKCRDKSHCETCLFKGK